MKWFKNTLFNVTSERLSSSSVNDYTKQIKIEQKLYVIWRYIAHKIAFNKRITNKWSPAQHI